MKLCTIRGYLSLLELEPLEGTYFTEGVRVKKSRVYSRTLTKGKVKKVG